MNFQNLNLFMLTKWVSSLLILVGSALTVSNIYPLNMYLLLVGITGWLGVALAWLDRSLIMLNTVAALIFTSGIIANLI